jgi:hypothetical protein
MSRAPDAPPTTGSMNELDAKVEEIFDRADDLMINQKDFHQAK